jgi:hypothetical protein
MSPKFGQHLQNILYKQPNQILVKFSIGSPEQIYKFATDEKHFLYFFSYNKKQLNSMIRKETEDMTLHYTIGKETSLKCYYTCHVKYKTKISECMNHLSRPTSSL